MQDVTDLLTDTEKQAADKWKEKHATTCPGKGGKPDERFVVTSAVSGYGYRLKILCEWCGAKEDVTDKTGRDVWPHKA
jgi:hypothetical protein